MKSIPQFYIGFWSYFTVNVTVFISDALLTSLKLTIGYFFPN